MRGLHDLYHIGIQPLLLTKKFRLWRCRRWGHELTVDTEAFERAVVEISKLGGSGSGQFNVPPGRWLTTPFNLTSHMTLFLAEDSEILGVD
ncbi:hypothetical protein YC2023_084924 [Brassica napus]